MWIVANKLGVQTSEALSITDRARLLVDSTLVRGASITYRSCLRLLKTVSYKGLVDACYFTSDLDPSYVRTHSLLAHTLCEPKVQTPPEPQSQVNDSDLDDWADLPLFYIEQDPCTQTRPTRFSAQTFGFKKWADWVLSKRSEYSERLGFKGELSTQWRTPTTMEAKRVRYTDMEKLFAIETRSQVSLYGQVYKSQESNVSSIVCDIEYEGLSDSDLKVLAYYETTEANPNANPRTICKLENKSTSWSTPSVGEVSKGSSDPLDKGELRICNDPLLRLGNCDMKAQMWATPKMRDYKDSQNTTELKPYKSGRRRLDDLPLQALHDETYSGVLNTRWVECLMGLPIGWVSPCSPRIYTSV